MNVEWSDAALADLDRFATFLAEHHPHLSAIVAREIGRPIADREEYRQLVLQVLNAAYVFQYRYDGQRLVMLRIFHGREARD
jgi:plasmid stabilization system protein ParE